MDQQEDRYSFPEGGDPPSPVTEPSGSLFPAVAAGLVAAIVGALVWGLIVKISDYEVGIVAWGIGLIDCQVHTEHLERFGAYEVPRSTYLELLKIALDEPTRRGRWTFELDLDELDCELTSAG